MHMVTALLCFVVVIHWLIFPYPSGLLHWHCGNLTIAPVPAKQPWWIWINTSCEFIMNDCITTTKQSTTKPCAYFLGYTVDLWSAIHCYCLDQEQSNNIKSRPEDWGVTLGHTLSSALYSLPYILIIRRIEIAGYKVTLIKSLNIFVYIFHFIELHHWLLQNILYPRGNLEPPHNLIRYLSLWYIVNNFMQKIMSIFLCHKLGARPLSQPLKASFTDAYIHHLTSVR